MEHFFLKWGLGVIFNIVRGKQTGSWMITSVQSMFFFSILPQGSQVQLQRVVVSCGFEIT